MSSFRSDVGCVSFSTYIQVALLIYKTLCIFMSLQFVVMLGLECLHLQVALVLFRWEMPASSYVRLRESFKSATQACLVR